MKHILHALGVAVAVCVAAAPSIAASPAVLNFVENHPSIAIYVPLVTGVISALAKAYRDYATR